MTKSFLLIFLLIKILFNFFNSKLSKSLSFIEYMPNSFWFVNLSIILFFIIVGEFFFIIKFNLQTGESFLLI